MFYAEEDKALCALVEKVGSPSNLLPYGPHPSEIRDQQTYLLHEGKETPVQVFGQHNMQNLQVAKNILNEIDVIDEEFYHHIQSFAGASKRMEKLGRKTMITTIFKDFRACSFQIKSYGYCRQRSVRQQSISRLY